MAPTAIKPQMTILAIINLLIWSTYRWRERVFLCGAHFHDCSLDCCGHAAVATLGPVLDTSPARLPSLREPFPIG